MKAKITRELLRDTKPTTKTIDIMDTDVRGFLARITPSGAINYGIRYSDRNGKQCRYSLGKTFPSTSVSDAREEARTLLGSIAQGNGPAADKKARQAGRLTLFQFIEGDYGDHLRHRPKTADSTIERLKKCFVKFKDTPLSDLDAKTINSWRAARTKAGIAPSTINRDIGALRPVFSRAVDWGLLPTNPLAPVKPLKNTADPLVRYLTDDEETRLRAALISREERDRVARTKTNAWRIKRKIEPLPELPHSHFVDYLHPAVLLSINTGIRQGELTSLTWDRVKLDGDASIFISGNAAKSGKGRHIPLNAEAKAALTQWKSQQRDTALVFPGREGNPITEVKTAWRNLLADAEIVNFRWHDMRHHFASRLVMASVDLNTVRELLGHGDLKMTLRYAHLAPEHKAAAVGKLVRPMTPTTDEA
ncbi:tyrosine-type recombinase/integrase [Pseudoduganella danionis]|uniref:Tyrosine-type recombinase/integrase n=1 Tax=Pseudoduganella danionis TaxID=1890295 RepID=A0ABW9SRU5_9BURK|nr:tyrosine-type recombinase/integrase [Pseudoduganella danionis]MTW34732.1 tyrosine-type recombinase/integrase [Pseudoduganella danionis]